MPSLTVEGVGTFEVPQGKRLVLALVDEGGLDQLHACGGNARCTTCRVEFAAGEPESMTAAEKSVLAGRATQLPNPLRSRHDRARDQPLRRERPQGCRETAGGRHSTSTGGVGAKVKAAGEASSMGFYAGTDLPKYSCLIAGQLKTGRLQFRHSWVDRYLGTSPQDEKNYCQTSVSIVRLAVSRDAPRETPKRGSVTTVHHARKMDQT
jgi:hypothetical protein